VIETDHILTVWIEDNHKCIPLSRAAIQTTTLNLSNRKNNEAEETFNAGIWFD
jgi:hypothetical protein